MEELKVQEILFNKYGYDISHFSVPFIKKIINTRKDALKYQTIEEYITELNYNQEEVKKLIDSLQIPFTMFFRDGLTFELLSTQIIPHLVRKLKNNQEIRIWDVGCSSGQETYSLAITLEEVGTRMNRNIPYRIFASDISDESLNKAIEGRYSIAEIGNLKYQYLRKYFTEEMGKYTISNSIKNKIHFGFFNLLDDTKLSPDESVYATFDIIMCSNVLYYYHETTQQKMISKLFKSLSASGYFITSETERYLVKTGDDVELATFQSAIFYKSKRGDFL